MIDAMKALDFLELRQEIQGLCGIKSIARKLLDEIALAFDSPLADGEIFLRQGDPLNDVNQVHACRSQSSGASSSVAGGSHNLALQPFARP